LRNDPALGHEVSPNQRLAFCSILLPNKQRLATEKATIMLLGYARISKSDDQDAAPQIRALKKAGCKKVFEEAASGGRWDRPELHCLLDQMRAGDALVVWKLDRLSRSLKDLLVILERIDAMGCKFRSLTESIDTSGPAGRMMMQMLGSFAEFEREMIRERTL
jgi:DNA invertase Pin-like site-specific DNA recombinase